MTDEHSSLHLEDRPPSPLFGLFLVVAFYSLLYVVVRVVLV